MGRAGRPAASSVRVVATGVLGGAVAGLILGRPSPTLAGRLAVDVVVTVVVAAALLASLRFGARRSGAWLALLTGVVGVTATATLVGDAAQRSGAWAEVTIAAVGLVAAAVLAWSGAAALIGPIRARRRWLALPVALVLLQLVVHPVLAGVLASARLPIPPTGRVPADVGLGYEDLRLVTADGVELAAWYVPASNGAAVVLLHGAGSTRASTLAHAEVLAGCGYGVLMVDARGHGDSEGLPMDLGWQADADVRAAVDALAARPDVEAIGLVGLSMGGEEALTAAAGDDRVSVVVAEGVGRRSAADAGATPAGWHGWLERTVVTLDMAVADALSTAHPPIPLREAVGRIAPRPVLLIAGRGEADQVEWYRSAAPDAVEVVSLPDTPHIGSLAADPAWWRDTACSHLDAAILQGPSG
ncbi:MAG TPA: alpha/beta fold hydrolase [Actinotalea sp.]